MKKTFFLGVIITMVALFSFNVQAQRRTKKDNRMNKRIDNDPIMQVDNLTKEQKDKIMFLREQNENEMKKYRDELREGRDKIREMRKSDEKSEKIERQIQRTQDLKKKMVSERDKLEKNVLNVLTKDQQEQVKEIRRSYEKERPRTAKKPCCEDHVKCKDKNRRSFRKENSKESKRSFRKGKREYKDVDLKKESL